jgi:DNA primase
MTIETLLGLLDGVTRTPRGYKARCPAHSDKSPSLAIREAEDGRILLHCFAGCNVHQICEAISIEIRDLFPWTDCASQQVRAARRRKQEVIQQREEVQRLKNAIADARRIAQCRLAAAKGLSIAGWTEAFLDLTVERIANAHDVMWPTILEELNESV